MNNVLGIEVVTSDFDIPLLIVNKYGPCQERVSFWINLLAKAVMKNQNLVIGGDLNFSIGIVEAWGPTVREDRLSEFFLNAFSSHNMIEANMIKLNPTWRNRRTGEDKIAKRLDRFFLSEDLASRILVFRQWVGEGGNSDHFPVLLKLVKPPLKPTTPFKFNASCMQQESFKILFNESWQHPSRDTMEDKSFLFMENMKRLKKAMVVWAKKGSRIKMKP